MTGRESGIRSSLQACPHDAGNQLQDSRAQANLERTSNEDKVKSLLDASIFVRRQRSHRQRVNLLPHAVAERAVDVLVTRDTRLALERRADD